LSAYIRENAPWPPKSSKSSEGTFIKPPRESFVSDSAANETAEHDKGAEQDAEPTPQTPPADIRAILDVLKRREEDRVPEKHRVIFDLRGTDLRSADLIRVNLQGAYLHEANLGEAYLNEAHLEGAYLTDTNLREAYLDGAHLEGAYLNDAHLERATLDGTHLGEAHLVRAHLKEARDLTQEQINSAIGERETTLPDDLVRPGAWSKSYEEQAKILEERQQEQM
jgi:hypothetical protein